MCADLISARTRGRNAGRRMCADLIGAGAGAGAAAGAPGAAVLVVRSGEVDEPEGSEVWAAAAGAFSAGSMAASSSFLAS